MIPAKTCILDFVKGDSKTTAKVRTAQLRANGHPTATMWPWYRDNAVWRWIIVEDKD